MAKKITRHVYRLPPDLALLCEAATLYLRSHTLHSCFRCYERFSGSGDFCPKCEKQREVDARVQARLLPRVKTIYIRDYSGGQ